MAAASWDRHWLGKLRHPGFGFHSKGCGLLGVAVASRAAASWELQALKGCGILGVVLITI